ncbi:TetR/AcrR family transcriptional regulator [Pseudofrankia sp. BMG5.37]|uniref:TetR/AcrR family transcriptional regulator n=1 Tax=Pseudofrankia sp. BMG5.37 TaxID=3050035 RepID=UPI00289435BC|nr:TetR/AcrR family transcriptional regulator [Pseudofrankia sp. BMG5.37]MDT3440207.1 TetR/AcrR family transcriptional regulator [Pseudofrankia sp. BMG5.37]
MAEAIEGVTGQAPRDRSRRGRATKDPAGRTQILDAAVACILELGFYRASTNEIARRANVSWGAIQYYFGSREALMIAAAEELNRRFIDAIAERHVEGDTLETRIHSLYDLLAQYYSEPTFLARLQILLNLQHDPDTSADATESLRSQAERVAGEIRRLLTETLGEDADPGRSTVLFHAIRGFAISQQLAESACPPIAEREAATRTRFLAGIVATELQARNA